MGIRRNISKRFPWIKEAYLAIQLEYNYLFKMNEKDKELVRYRRAGGEKLRFGYDLKDSDVVFDLGGYLGDWTAQLPNPNCRVYVFEPVKEFSDKCSDRFKDRENIKCYPFGLDATTHKANISHEADASTQYHSTEDEETADFVDIESFMDDNGIDDVRLMKMNIEGGEYDILEKLIKSGRIKQFDNLQIQFHDIPEIDSERRMKAIWADLEKTHKLTWAYRPYIHENWERRKDI